MLGKGLESLIPPNQHQSDEDEVAVPLREDVHEEPHLLFALGDEEEEGEEEGEEERESQRSREGTREAIYYLEVEKIQPNPRQPRKQFDEERMKELAESVREFGILQPLIVRKVEREVEGGTKVHYELIAGERRLMAAKRAGLPRAPAIVRNVGIERERLELAIIENLQREDLNPIEMARAFDELKEEFRLTQREIASRVGKSREAIANTLRLLDLPPRIQEEISGGTITESHGRLLLTIDDPAVQERLFQDLLENQVTTRELRRKVKRVVPEHERTSRQNIRSDPELQTYEERLSSGLGAPVHIRKKGEKGKITIEFYSKEELRGIVERLGEEEEF